VLVKPFPLMMNATVNIYVIKLSIFLINVLHFSILVLIFSENIRTVLVKTIPNISHNNGILIVACLYQQNKWWHLVPFFSYSAHSYLRYTYVNFFSGKQNFKNVQI
jgi:hypothetical protein